MLTGVTVVRPTVVRFAAVRVAVVPVWDRVSALPSRPPLSGGATDLQCGGRPQLGQDKLRFAEHFRRMLIVSGKTFASKEEYIVEEKKMLKLTERLQQKLGDVRLGDEADSPF